MHYNFWISFSYTTLRRSYCIAEKSESAVDQQIAKLKRRRKKNSTNLHARIDYLEYIISSGNLMLKFATFSVKFMLANNRKRILKYVEEKTWTRTTSRHIEITFIFVNYRLGFISQWGALAGRYAALCPPGWPWAHHRMPFSPTHGE